MAPSTLPYTMKYTSVPLDDNPGTDLDVIEDKGRFSSPRERAISLSWWLLFKVLVILNVLLTIFLISHIVHVKSDLNCIPGPAPPYSPVRDDMAIRHINTKYVPRRIFQSETSEEVETAWEGWLKEHDRLLILPTEPRLPITVDAFLDPGYSVYGLAVYHQMHCLNHIRKTFYGDRFFPNVSSAKVTFHKNHCFDMLRQAIMCHGDIAIMHWWNDTYSYVDHKGTLQLTDHYRSLTPSQQAEGAFAKWDADVQCRDLNAINAWALAHSMKDAKYAATVGQVKRSV